MCVGCQWATYRDFASSSAPGGSGLTRRQALRRGAAFAASAVAGSYIGPSFVAEAVADDNPHADTVFRNGPVYTVANGNPWARAVAVKGKRIAFVGDEAGVEVWVGPQTRVVDLAGKMLMPGFVEGHTHPLVGATVTRGADLQFDSRGEIVAALKAYRDAVGSPEVVRGFGWRYTAFPPTGPKKEDLDALWPDVPVILIAIDAHGAWVNSQALALAGIAKDTKDPLPGFSYFERDPATGEPTGYLVEVPAIMQVNNAIEPFSGDYVAQSLSEWLPKAAEAGLTSLFDAGIQIVPDNEGYAIYAQLERAGKLPFRVVGSHYYNNPAADPIPAIKALRREFDSELVQARVLKLNIDGGDSQYTAAMLAPYSDDPKTSGNTLLPPATFADIVSRADREGIDIHVHAWGDRGARLALDAFEAATKANPPRDRRNAAAHLPLIDPEDVSRFGKLGVYAQFSAQWAAPDRQWLQVNRSRWGARADAEFSMKSILDHGGALSFGTDWPAANYYSTFRPLDAIEIATTRRELDRPDGPSLAPAAEAISLDAALKANTLGAASQLRMEQDVGSVEAGKFADLVVLEKNLFEVAPHDIHKTKVLMTMMNGRFTHGG